MSKEIVEELIEVINESTKKDFPSLLDTVIDYGFIDDIGLTQLFGIELEDLEELMYSDESLSPKDWKSYAVKLRNYMKREKAKYERMYYRQDDEKTP